MSSDLISAEDWFHADEGPREKEAGSHTARYVLIRVSKHAKTGLVYFFKPVGNLKQAQKCER
eukprot:6174570-Pleurochrysis_carterae.AAC.7